jgi:hypothetical protein
MGSSIKERNNGKATLDVVVLFRVGLPRLVHPKYLSSFGSRENSGKKSVSKWRECEIIAGEATSHH